MKETRFTPEQLLAVEVCDPNRDTCVVAGPGSGKTTVLVEYFRRLVAEAQVDPQRILAITFTEKAAGNMRSKLAETFAERTDIRGALERAWVGTVHGFCTRLLKENAVFAGVDPEFYVADDRESWRMQHDAMAAAVEALFQEQPGAVRALIRGLSSIDFEQDILSAYDAMRGAGRRINDVAAQAPPAGTVTLAEVEDSLEALKREPRPLWTYPQKQYLDEAIAAGWRIVEASTPREALQAAVDFSPNLNKCKRGSRPTEMLKCLRDEKVKSLIYSLITEVYARERELLLEIMRRFDALYRERKRQAGALDFADLEEFAVRLLDENEEVRARLQAQFDHILMDEFQDTNPQQARLLELVRAPHRFYAVGDINQSIFGFRHAEPQGFSRYRDDVESCGARLVHLLGNFRSRPEILRAVETVFDGAGGIEARRLTAEKSFDAPRSFPVELIAAAAEDSDRAQRLEAQWVARRIAELVTGGDFGYRDIAVLVRNTEVIGDFTEAFEEAGIPYLVNRGRGFYATREVNDLTHLLRVIANPRDEISLAAVLRSPLVGVADETLLRLKLADNNLGTALAALPESDDAGFDPGDFRKLQRFSERLHEWRIRREHAGFDRLLLAALDDCGYRTAWATFGRGQANIDKFLAQARAASRKMSLDEFVDELSRVRQENPREPDAPPEDSADAVTVMTVHSAKGLEFPAVFVAALHKGIDSDAGVVAFDPAIGLGARWRNPAGGKDRDKDDLYQRAIRQALKKREADEANRLLYVAMTRAERHLTLSFASTERRKAEQWAKLVVTRLGMVLSPPREEELSYEAPDGSPWRLRLLVTDRAPELLRVAAVEEDAEEVEWLARPEVTGQQDTHTTVTALAEFSRCPRRYFLGHYLGFTGRTAQPGEESEDGPRLAANEFGTQVHNLLAGKPVAEPDEEALRLVEVFRHSPLGRRVAEAAVVEREFDFLMALDGPVIRGQVDLWFEHRGELAIVDYKTDTVTAAEAHRRAQDYSLQLRLYAMAVERVAGRAPDRAWLHFLRPNTLVEVSLAPSLFESPAQVVREFTEAQSQMVFPLNTGEHCHRCPFFRGACPAGAAGESPAPPRTNNG